MRRRNALPERWLFTDERQGAALWTALERLPRGSGVVFRHYGVFGRVVLLNKVEAAARRRGLLLVVAGEEIVRRHLPRPTDRPTSRHAYRHANRHARSGRFLTASAHSVPELVRARRMGARLAFLSPVFPTRSHPDARPLGPVRFGLMTRRVRIEVAALGGMTPRRFRRLKPLGASAWGAISAFS